MPARAALLPLALLCAAMGGCSLSEDDPEGPSAGPLARVTSVIDGDTVDVRLTGSGERDRVRLLGIDAPERTTLRTGRTECGGDQAKAALERLVDDGGVLMLVTDPSQGERDQYGRTLAYLDPALGGPSLQERLLEQGWVTTYIRRRNPIERSDQFYAAATEARSNGTGIWKLCGGNFRRPN